MKLAIIGTGKIVHEALFAIQELKEITLTAIFARPHSRATGEELAEKYGIGAVYTDYERLLEESGADAVYIGLVNSAHFSYAKKALEHDMDVILEKPLVSTAKEAQELAALAREKHRYVLEAITVLHSAVFDKMKQWLPKLGRIKLVQANYSQYSSRYDSYLEGKVAPAFDPLASGGALYDINLYNIYWCIGLFGEPSDAQYFPNVGFNGIDTSGTAVLSYHAEADFTAVCSAAKDSDSDCFVMVQGEKGWMRLNGKPNSGTEASLTYLDPGHQEAVRSAAGSMDRAMLTEEFAAPAMRHRMTQEFTDFAKIIDGRGDAAADGYLSNSVSVIRTLENARKASGIRFGVDG